MQNSGFLPIVPPVGTLVLGEALVDLVREHPVADFMDARVTESWGAVV